MEEIIEYIKRVKDAVCKNNTNFNTKVIPDFYLVCPCCGTQESLALFDDSGEMVSFNASGKIGKFRYPFDTPKTAGFSDYYGLVDSLQNKTNNYMIEAKDLYLGKGNAYNIAYNKHGKDLFILSPCWGLIKADFKLPTYNFEFIVRETSSQLDNHFRYINKKGADLRNEWKGKGFNHLSASALKNPRKPIVILGGASYIYRFYGIYNECKLQNPVCAIVGESKVANILSNKNWHIKKVDGYTNWHYKYMVLI